MGKRREKRTKVRKFNKVQELEILGWLINNDGDNCMVCRRQYEHGDMTVGGYIDDTQMAVVGFCCARKLHTAVTVGVYLCGACQ